MLQIALGIKADGILGKATVKALQKKAGASPDGAWGPKTSKKVQKMIGTKVDGVFGRNSVIALQKWINAKVYPSSKSKTAATKKAEAKPVQLTEREKKINAMCDWATKIAGSGKYKYKKWKNKKKNTHKCPICHPGSGNG